MEKWSYLRFAALGALAPVPLQAQTAPAPAPAAPPSAPAPTPPPPAFRPPFSPGAVLRPFASSQSITTRFPASRDYQANYQQAGFFGRCAAKFAPRRSAELLEALPNTLDERRRLSLVGAAAGACVPYQFGSPLVFVRGAVAEGLYHRLAPADALHSGGVTPAAFRAFAADEARLDRTRLADDRLFTRLGTCLAVRSPEGVRDLLATRHGSGEEGSALNALFAASPACVDRPVFPATGPRTFLRAYIADAAYRWAEADRSAHARTG